MPDDNYSPAAPNTVFNADGTVAAVSSGEPVAQAAVPPTIDWESWHKPIAAMTEQLGSKLDGLQETVRTATAPPPVQEALPDLETMTNAELSAHIVSQVMKGFQTQLAEALKPVLDTAQQAQVTASTVDLNRSIDQLKTQHKDFGDWKDEMIALAKTHPSLGVAELYTLAKGSHPEKAQQLHLKYNPPPPPRQPRFGGLIPGAPAGSNGAVKPLSPQEASYQAYAEVQARHPDILAALGNL